MDRKELGLKIAKLRQAKNLSAYELSLRIEKSHNYMYLVEMGNVNFTIDAFLAICRELEISPADLFKN